MKFHEAEKLIREYHLCVVTNVFDTSITFVMSNSYFIGRFIINRELFKAKLELYDLGENEHVENLKTYEDYEDAKKAINIKIKNLKESEIKEKIKKLNTDFS